MGLGKKLKNTLDSKHMTVIELSNLTGISSSTLYAIIRRDSDNVNLETVKKIATALNMSLDDFIPEYDPHTEIVNSMFGDFYAADGSTMDIHFTTDEFTTDELLEIINYAEYLKSKRNTSAHGTTE